MAGFSEGSSHFVVLFFKTLHLDNVFFLLPVHLRVPLLTPTGLLDIASLIFFKLDFSWPQASMRQGTKTKENISREYNEENNYH